MFTSSPCATRHATQHVSAVEQRADGERQFAVRGLGTRSIDQLRHDRNSQLQARRRERFRAAVPLPCNASIVRECCEYNAMNAPACGRKARRAVEIVASSTDG